MASRRILVTGGLGFFASRLVARFQDRYDILAPGRDRLDINDEAQIADAFAGFKPDLLIHAAANASTAFCDANPGVAHRINVEATVNLGRACAASGAGMVFLSTEQVFNGNKEPGPYRESDAAAPDTVYGQNKLEAEAELRTLLERLWVMRFTWLFGLPERRCGMSPNVLWNTVQALMAGRKLSERTNEYRGVTYVHDLIDRFEAILECPCDTYHVGSRSDLSRYDLARCVFTALGLADRFEALVEPAQAPATRDIRLDNSKLAALGVAFPTSAEGLTRCVGDFRFAI